MLRHRVRPHVLPAQCSFDEGIELLAQEYLALLWRDLPAVVAKHYGRDPLKRRTKAAQVKAQNRLARRKLAPKASDAGLRMRLAAMQLRNRKDEQATVALLQAELERRTRPEQELSMAQRFLLRCLRDTATLLGRGGGLTTERGVNCRPSLFGGMTPPKGGKPNIPPQVSEFTRPPLSGKELIELVSAGRLTMQDVKAELDYQESLLRGAEIEFPDLGKVALARLGDICSGQLDSEGRETGVPHSERTLAALWGCSCQSAHVFLRRLRERNRKWALSLVAATLLRQEMREAKEKRTEFKSLWRKSFRIRVPGRRVTSAFDVKQGAVLVYASCGTGTAHHNLTLQRKALRDKGLPTFTRFPLPILTCPPMIAYQWGGRYPSVVGNGTDNPRIHPKGGPSNWGHVRHGRLIANRRKWLRLADLRRGRGVFRPIALPVLECPEVITVQPVKGVWLTFYGKHEQGTERNAKAHIAARLVNELVIKQSGISIPTTGGFSGLKCECPAGISVESKVRIAAKRLAARLSERGLAGSDR
jgi:hypothetical protein